MTIFLLSIIPASLFIYGFNILFQEGHLLEKQGEWITNKVGERWAKPLINCPICMSSIFGTLIFFLGLPISFDIHMPLKMWIPFVFCLCGFNTIVNKLTSKERVIIEEE